MADAVLDEKKSHIYHHSVDIVAGLLVLFTLNPKGLACHLKSYIPKSGRHQAQRLHQLQLPLNVVGQGTDGVDTLSENPCYDFVK